MEPHSFSGCSPVSTTARTASTGHSFWRNERTEERSSSCSAVNSSSTALPSRRCRLPLRFQSSVPRRRRQIGASVPDAHVSLRGGVLPSRRPVFWEERVWVCPGGVAGPWPRARAGDGGGGARSNRLPDGGGRSPTLCGAPLAQRQSNGLLIRRFRVRIPRGALRNPGEEHYRQYRYDTGAASPQIHLSIHLTDTLKCMGRAVEDLATRFERLVDRTGEHHLWLGSVNPTRGTGRIKVGNVAMTAHRVAWELAHGRAVADATSAHSLHRPVVETRPLENPPHTPFVARRGGRSAEAEECGRGIKSGEVRRCREVIDAGEGDLGG